MSLHAPVLPDDAEAPVPAANNPMDEALLQLLDARRALQATQREMARAEVEYAQMAMQRLCACVTGYTGPADVASMRQAVEAELDAVHRLRDTVMHGLADEMAAIEERIAQLEQRLCSAPGLRPHLTLQ